jgi:NAD-dependent SIR2 family protein deacetylase
MKDYDNVECTRCGKRWYSDELEEDGEVPDLCPRCYRDAVREIPEPPTRMEIFLDKLSEKKDELPEKISEKKHDIVVWRENNKLLISLINTGLIITILVSILIYLLFMTDSGLI